MNCKNLLERQNAAPVSHSIEAEQAVLGGLMLDNSAWNKIAGQISEDDFYNSNHKLIFRAISTLSEQKQPFDVIIIGEKLKQLSEFDTEGRRHRVAKYVLLAKKEFSSYG